MPLNSEEQRIIEVQCGCYAQLRMKLEDLEHSNARQGIVINELKKECERNQSLLRTILAQPEEIEKALAYWRKRPDEAEQGGDRPTGRSIVRNSDYQRRD